MARHEPPLEPPEPAFDDQEIFEYGLKHVPSDDERDYYLALWEDENIPAKDILDAMEDLGYLYWPEPDDFL